MSPNVIMLSKSVPICYQKLLAVQVDTNDGTDGTIF